MLSRLARLNNIRHLNARFQRKTTLAAVHCFHWNKVYRTFLWISSKFPDISHSSMPSSCRAWTIVTPFLPDHQDTLLTSCSVYWMLQRVLSLARTSLTTACHTCCMRNCTGSTSQNVSTTNWKSQCTAVCRTRLLSTWSTAVYQSQTFPADVIYGQPLDITWPSVPRYQLSSFRRRAFSVAGPKAWNSHRTVSVTWSSVAIAEDEPISSLPLNTHSAVEMHNSALYKSTDIDIHQTSIPFHEFPRISR